jgi:hypothetical protein
MEMCLGVDAEQRSLEDGAEPLSARSARSALTWFLAGPLTAARLPIVPGSWAVLLLVTRTGAEVTPGSSVSSSHGV